MSASSPGNSQHTATVEITGKRELVAALRSRGSSTTIGDIAGDAWMATRPVLFALALFTSPATSGLDLWAVDPRRSTSSVWVAASRGRARRLTLGEARRIALEILLLSEHNRDLAAEAEAAVGIQWEQLA